MESPLCNQICPLKHQQGSNLRADPFQEISSFFLFFCFHIDILKHIEETGASCHIGKLSQELFIKVLMLEVQVRMCLLKLVVLYVGFKHLLHSSLKLESLFELYKCYCKNVYLFLFIFLF